MSKEKTYGNKTFGTYLKGLRTTAGLTQAQAAEAAGVSAIYISTLERGVDCKPSEKVLKNLGKAYGISPPLLLAQSGVTPVTTAPVEVGSGPLETAYTELLKLTLDDPIRVKIQGVLCAMRNTIAKMNDETSESVQNRCESHVFRMLHPLTEESK